jgi:hypothetical protein
MKLHEFITGILMFAIILGIVAASQPAEACGDTHLDTAPVIRVIRA